MIKVVSIVELCYNFCFSVGTPVFILLIPDFVSHKIIVFKVYIPLSVTTFTYGSHSSLLTMNEFRPFVKKWQVEHTHHVILECHFKH